MGAANGPWNSAPPAELRETCLEVAPAVPAQAHCGAVGQAQLAIATEQRMDFAHPCQVDDRRTMHAEELLRIELALDLVHGFPQQMALSAAMQRHVVVGRLDRSEGHPSALQS